MASEFDLGYAMGLIVGAGSFTSDRRQAALSVKMHERDPRPLEHLRAVFGGRVFGPYAHGDRHYYLYLLRGPALRASLDLLVARMPACHKREQLLAWAARHDAELRPVPSDSTAADGPR